MSLAQTPPNFTLVSTNGDTMNLYETIGSGKMVILDFFFTTCVPCQTYTPEMVALIAQYDSNDIEVWGISDRNDDSTVIQFGQDLNVSYSLAGYEGGGDTVTQLYRSWYSFLGWPTYGVVCTDTSISWGLTHDIGMTEIKDAIDNCDSNGTFLKQNDISLHQQITVYPNSINIRADRKLYIQLISISGIVMDQKTVEAGSNYILSLDNLPPSLYLLKSWDGKSHFTKKIIKTNHD